MKLSDISNMDDKGTHFYKNSEVGFETLRSALYGLVDDTAHTEHVNEIIDVTGHGFACKCKVCN